MEIPNGVTKRQLHYWITKGYIFAYDQPTSPGRGHPHPAEWDEYTTKVIQSMARMRELGFEAPEASELAHKLAGQDWSHALWLKVPIGSGANLDVELATILAHTWER